MVFVHRALKERSMWTRTQRTLLPQATPLLGSTRVPNVGRTQCRSHIPPRHEIAPSVRSADLGPLRVRVAQRPHPICAGYAGRCITALPMSPSNRSPRKRACCACGYVRCRHTSMPDSGCVHGSDTGFKHTLPRRPNLGASAKQPKAQSDCTCHIAYPCTGRARLGAIRISRRLSDPSISTVWLGQLPRMGIRRGHAEDHGHSQMAF